MTSLAEHKVTLGDGDDSDDDDDTMQRGSKRKGQDPDPGDGKAAKRTRFAGHSRPVFERRVMEVDTAAEAKMKTQQPEAKAVFEAAGYTVTPVRSPLMAFANNLPLPATFPDESKRLDYVQRLFGAQPAVDLAIVYIDSEAVLLNLLGGMLEEKSEWPQKLQSATRIREWLETGDPSKPARRADQAALSSYPATVKWYLYLVVLGLLPADRIVFSLLREEGKFLASSEEIKDYYLYCDEIGLQIHREWQGPLPLANYLVAKWNRDYDEARIAVGRELVVINADKSDAGVFAEDKLAALIAQMSISGKKSGAGAASSRRPVEYESQHAFVHGHRRTKQSSDELGDVAAYFAFHPGVEIGGKKSAGSAAAVMDETSDDDDDSKALTETKKRPSASDMFTDNRAWKFMRRAVFNALDRYQRTPVVEDALSRGPVRVRNKTLVIVSDETRSARPAVDELVLSLPSLLGMHSVNVEFDTRLREQKGSRGADLPWTHLARLIKGVLGDILIVVLDKSEMQAIRDIWQSSKGGTTRRQDGQPVITEALLALVNWASTAAAQETVDQELQTQYDSLTDDLTNCGINTIAKMLLFRAMLFGGDGFLSRFMVILQDPPLDDQDAALEQACKREMQAAARAPKGSVRLALERGATAAATAVTAAGSLVAADRLVFPREDFWGHLERANQISYYIGTAWYEDGGDWGYTETNTLYAIHNTQNVLLGAAALLAGAAGAAYLYTRNPEYKGSRYLEAFYKKVPYLRLTLPESKELVGEGQRYGVERINEMLLQRWVVNHKLATAAIDEAIQSELVKSKRTKVKTSHVAKLIADYFVEGKMKPAQLARDAGSLGVKTVNTGADVVDWTLGGKKAGAGTETKETKTTRRVVEIQTFQYTASEPEVARSESRKVFETAGFNVDVGDATHPPLFARDGDPLVIVDCKRADYFGQLLHDMVSDPARASKTRAYFAAVQEGKAIPADLNLRITPGTEQWYLTGVTSGALPADRIVFNFQKGAAFDLNLDEDEAKKWGDAHDRLSPSLHYASKTATSLAHFLVEKWNRELKAAGAAVASSLLSLNSDKSDAGVFGEDKLAALIAQMSVSGKKKQPGAGAGSKSLIEEHKVVLSDTESDDDTEPARKRLRVAPSAAVDTSEDTAYRQQIKERHDEDFGTLADRKFTVMVVKRTVDFVQSMYHPRLRIWRTAEEYYIRSDSDHQDAINDLADFARADLVVLADGFRLAETPLVPAKSMSEVYKWVFEGGPPDFIRFAPHGVIAISSFDWARHLESTGKLKAELLHVRVKAEVPRNQDRTFAAAGNVLSVDVIRDAYSNGYPGDIIFDYIAKHYRDPWFKKLTTEATSKESKTLETVLHHIRSDATDQYAARHTPAVLRGEILKFLVQGKPHAAESFLVQGGHSLYRVKKRC